ncbi:MAG: SprT-like domain-containing protein [bacterium]
MPNPTAGAAVDAFRHEYDRINDAVYGNTLPPFPGVDVVDRTDIFSMTRTVGLGPWRELRPFLLSRHVKGDLLLEAIRHEVAHAAALLFDDDEDHGPAWRRHAELCGAHQIATLDDGHPLRRDWPRR